MKKISTLFKKDPTDLGRVINEINPDNEWVFNSGVEASRKYDGTACAIINGELYKRYDVKHGKTVPEGAIPCQEADEITGHWPHWLKCDRNDNSNRWHFDAFDNVEFDKSDGTYELIGPKIQNNREQCDYHILVKHGSTNISIDKDNLSFDQIKTYLHQTDIEGIVFYEPLSGKMCKIRKSDFGIKR